MANKMYIDQHHYLDKINGVIVKVDDRTGEKSPLEAGESVVIMRKRNDNEEHKKQKAANNAAFDKERHINIVLNDSTKKLFREIKPANLTRLLYAATFAQYQDNPKGEMKPLRHEKKDLTPAKLKELLKIKTGTFYNFLHDVELTADENGVIHGVLRSDEKKLYFVDDIFFYGKFKRNHSIVTQQLFCEKYRCLYDKLTVEQHKKAGLILSLLPYMNRQYNVICVNPLVSKPGEIIPLNLKEIIYIMYGKIGNASKQIRELYNFLTSFYVEIDGKRYLFASFCEFNGIQTIQINPIFVHHGTNREEALSGDKWIAYEENKAQIAVRTGNIHIRDKVIARL